MARHPVFQSIYGEYTWCSICQKANRTETWVAKEWCCPNEYCKGQPFNAWDWRTVLSTHPDYPDHPDPDTRYTLT
jgi:hypothetical protein